LIRVLLVDDHVLVRKGILRILADAHGIEVAGVADNGEMAVLMARELKPDVVLMDLQMPGIGGLEATRKLAGSDPAIKIVVLTACVDDPCPTRLLQAGAWGYLGKSAAIEEMVRAIRVVYAGKRYVSSHIAQQLALKACQNNAEDMLFDRLSERENQIALMISKCHKVRDIAERLFISPKIINTYRYRIFSKLAISTDVELAMLAFRYGMVEAVG
jgi:two-component system, NarL family, invasion response regulator UvrY